jgi:magnesium transporter
MYTDTDAIQKADETAAGRLARNVPTASENDSCGAILAGLRGQRFEYAEAVVILDAADGVAGIVDIGNLVTQEPAIAIGSIMRSVPVATLGMDQEYVASLAIENDVSSVPVTTESGKFVGLVPPRTLFKVLRREHIEDLHRLTGMVREEALAREAMEGPPTRRARHRLPWLLVGLAGSALATLIMARYEAAIQTRIAIAFFVPGIVYIADAMGTQTEAIIVRGLSISHLGLRRLLAGELSTGLIIGIVLGSFAALGVWVATNDYRLAAAIGVALLVAGSLATLIGLLLPWLFHRFGMDPAYGSGPLATVTQDVLSLFVYFCSVGILLDLPI